MFPMMRLCAFVAYHGIGRGLAQQAVPHGAIEAGLISSRGHRGRRGTGRVSRTAAHLALRLLNFHKDGTVFEDPYITSGFRDDNGNSLRYRGNASRRHVA
jgi:hypothetical protein